MSTNSTSSGLTTTSTASDALVQAMLLIAPAGNARSAAKSARPAALNLASDALTHASRLITRFRSSTVVSNSAKEIANVRAMASRVRDTDHRLAGDMLATADRHERESESEALR